jgi:hypothetical protein
MLKTDTELTAQIQHGTINEIWTNEKVQTDWKNGTIIPLPKKGDLSKCNNWRGIKLLSVPGKVFCIVIYNRMKLSLGRVICEDHAGFRKGRSCCNHIFTLRKIIEQVLEWNATICINFLDFEKAFNSLHRETMWKIIKAYEFQDKS